MVREGIVLDCKVSPKGMEVDPAKVDIISKLPPPINMKGIKSVLGHAGFYRRFIKDFSKIAKPVNNLLLKNNMFDFDNDCLQAFELLKSSLSYGAIKLEDSAFGRTWLVNGQRLKHYLGGEVKRLTTTTQLKEP
uniref:Retrovirus-related Pol polyprotein from transposon opus n=1 Tax=Cajanus cajan TaxID=3821 RepID=A0A151UA43_CAJCA|nr:Retrovirus-related Pol polyprotein from transposon opus [Cajanus cajan]